MGKPQREWARQARADLVKKLGGKCSICGEKIKLEIDCIEPRGHEHHRMEWSQRISFYRRQDRDGNLQLLCRSCHERKSRFENTNGDNTPF